MGRGSHDLGDAFGGSSEWEAPSGDSRDRRDLLWGMFGMGDPSGSSWDFEDSLASSLGAGREKRGLKSCCRSAAPAQDVNNVNTCFDAEKWIRGGRGHP